MSQADQVGDEGGLSPSDLLCFCFHGGDGKVLLPAFQAIRADLEDPSHQDGSIFFAPAESPAEIPISSQGRSATVAWTPGEEG